MKITANQSGTRTIDVNESHLETIKDYQLFRNLIDSTGIIDEEVLEKLRLNVKSLLENSIETDKALISLALEVIFHKDMKAIGLRNLIVTFHEWMNSIEQNPKTEEISQD